MLPVIETYVNELFGSEQYMGVKYYPVLEDSDDVESYIGDGEYLPATCCTSYAMVIYDLCKKFGIPAKIYGFANKDNPDAEFVKKGYHPGGHDFVVAFDTFIIDPWPLLFVVDAPNRVLFDTKHPAVNALYGTNWRHMTAAEEAATELCAKANTERAFEDRKSWIIQLKSLLSMWRTHTLRERYNGIQTSL